MTIEDPAAKEEAFEAVPAGEREVEAGAGRHIARAVQWTVCCWKTGQLLEILISVKEKETKRPHGCCLDCTAKPVNGPL